MERGSGARLRSAITKTERNSLRAILQGFQEFILIPEPGEEPGEAFLVMAKPDSYVDNYLRKSQSGGYMASFQVEEVGGQ